jgi:hypothetical protein
MFVNNQMGSRDGGPGEGVLLGGLGNDTFDGGVSVDQLASTAQRRNHALGFFGAIAPSSEVIPRELVKSYFMGFSRSFWSANLRLCRTQTRAHARCPCYPTPRIFRTGS